MHKIWLSLTENMRCSGNIITDVIGQPERCRKKTMRLALAKEKKKLDSEQVVHLRGNPARNLSYRENYIPIWFNELDPEDISRKVVEMIVQKTSMEASKPSRSRIKSVIRIHYPIQMIERFEKYREKVKIMAYERYKRHLRSTVDGNELLRFYPTTMACYSGNYSNRIISQYGLCRDPKCRVCTILGCNFQMENMLKNGIPLSRYSDHQVFMRDDDDENTIRNITRSSAKKKNIRRAVILCRTIAGIIANTVNGGGDNLNNESFSVHDNTSDWLTVPNPSALLPCFVVVYKLISKLKERCGCVESQTPNWTLQSHCGPDLLRSSNLNV
ncbi:uncharacterized protein LOC107435495 [Ziziphus jujuba]|uniref:Uncharacterized protein LOC107435495 n=1 Tax=Ziziphus jujuba TaxID=326968 RepID=A0ABM4A0I3_ZIZJJ|nr:uncharacterized protein LOC107435495 [Ziziphus jujuba]